MDRVAADYTGMLATVMNSLALKDALGKVGVDSRIQTAIEMKEIAEPFILDRALHMSKRSSLIFAVGTGIRILQWIHLALRATEIGTDALFKATKCMGSILVTPFKMQITTRYSELSYMEILRKENACDG